MSTMRCERLIILFYICLPEWSGPRCLAQEDGDLRGAIIDAWRDRGESVRALDVSAKGPCLVKTAPGYGIPHESTRMGEEVSYEFTLHYVFDGADRVRIEYNQIWWSTADGRYEPSKVILIDDKAISRRFLGKGETVYPNLWIGNLKNRATNIRVDPINIVYRPFGRGSEPVFDPRKCVLTGKSGVLNGRPYVELKHESDTVWVDREQGWWPVRYYSVADKSARTVELFYERDGTGKRVLNKWKDTYQGTTFYSLMCHVDSIQINPPTDESLFVIDAPVGTIIRDHRDKTKYIQRGEGRQQPFTERVDNANYHMLLTKEEGRGSLYYVGWAIAMAVVLYIGYCYRDTYSKLWRRMVRG